MYSNLIRSALALCALLIVLSVSTASAQELTTAVTLTPSETTWKTLAYKLDADNGMIPGSLDSKSVVERTFQTYVLENEYLRVTLLPEFGGRILSIIYKPTGHEELYQNPLGVPYGIGEGNFYYDWLMVYGGIFPTFPEPEHGKTWLLPWNFNVVTQTPDEITVAMSMVDDIAFNKAPGKFSVGKTGIEATFYITLKAGRAALDTRLDLHNPKDRPIDYEYWMCVTLAPGSPPGSPRTTDGAEIIAPVQQVKMPPWWPDTVKQEQPTRTPDVYTFDKLRWFKNWVDEGIAYAYPDMGGANFWGVVNHDNEEGLIRIANNDVTPGMKLWTWGYESVNVDPFAQPPSESRPYIEMWAGASTEFFKRTPIAPNAELVSEETYVPTVGMSRVTQSSRDYLANFYVDDTGTANLQLFSVQSKQQVQVIITVDSAVIHETMLKPEVGITSTITVNVPAGAKQVRYRVVDEHQSDLLTGEVALK